MEKVLITGGSGFIGSHLTPFLLEKGFEVIHLSRNSGVRNGIRSFEWDPENGTMDINALNDVDYIIHLAGAGIADERWTKSRKKEIITSRTSGPNLLIKNIFDTRIQLKGFFSSSGINYFGSITTDKINTEIDPPGNDYIADVVIQWEKSVMQFERVCRTAMFRFGLVLDDEGGGLPKLAKPVKIGIGSPLGKGTQWVPWIHIDDVVNVFFFAMMNQHIHGIYNTVAPDHATNKTLIEKIAKTLGKKLFMPNVPAFVLKIILGELSTLVLDGSRASSEKLINDGFKFKYPDLDSALREVYSRNR